MRGYRSHPPQRIFMGRRHEWWRWRRVKPTLCGRIAERLEELNTPHAHICQAHVTLAKHEQRQGHPNAAWIELMKEQDQAAQQ